MNYIVYINTGYSLLSHSHNTPCLPPKMFCVSIVSNLFRDLQPSQENLKTILMQNFGG